VVSFVLCPLYIRGKAPGTYWNVGEPRASPDMMMKRKIQPLLEIQTQLSSTQPSVYRLNYQARPIIVLKLSGILET
jgi:hypothetical protein